MENITEKDLTELGFRRVDVSKEESGDFAYHYYVWELGDFCLISHASDQIKDDKWKIEIFDYYDFRFSAKDQLIDLMNALNSGFKNKTTDE